jgi:hypothetical protein
MLLAVAFALVMTALPAGATDVSLNEDYKIPSQTALVPDPGWLNVGCNNPNLPDPNDPNAYSAPGRYPVGVTYDVETGTLKTKFKADYLGLDDEGQELYSITQSFDFKKAVFQLYDLDINWRAGDDWEYVQEPTGEFFYDESEQYIRDVVAIRLDPGEPVSPMNVAPIEGPIHLEFRFFSVVDGSPGHWLVLDGTLPDDVTLEGTCSI